MAQPKNFEFYFDGTKYSYRVGLGGVTNINVTPDIEGAIVKVQIVFIAGNSITYNHCIIRQTIF